MFKKEITPLSDSMVDAISQSINTLQHTKQEEPEAVTPEAPEAPEAPEEVSEEKDTHKTKDGRTAKKGLWYNINKKKERGEKPNPKGHPDRPSSQDFEDARKTTKEEVELEESMVASLAKDFEKRITKGGALASDRTQEKERMATLAMAKKKGASAMDMKNLDKAMNAVMNKLDEAMDPVNPKAVKKKFDDRKDKDIDNDGDTDSSDEYLHKRRKAISKALSKD